MIPIVLMTLINKDTDNEGRFRDLVIRYWDPMVRAAEKILNDRMDAEEAAQDAFMIIYRNYEKYMGFSESSMAALLYTVTRNRAIDIFRRQQRNESKELEFIDELYVPADIYDNKGSGKLITAMNKLKESDRSILMLKYYYEIDIKDIADMYGLTTKSIYKKIERAKERLAKALKEGHDE